MVRCTPPTAPRLHLAVAFTCAALALSAGHASAAQLILNGDFQSGDTGFTTAYVNPPTTVVGGAGQYLIVVNPVNHHPSGANYFDHTFGNSSGKMMMVNESGTANTLVWGQVLMVAPNSDYTFAAWVSSWVSAAPSKLDVLINGTSLGTINAPSSTGTWLQFSANWNSGASTSADIQIRSLTTADIGGDFALDDISLTGPAAVPEPSSLALTLAGGAGLAAGTWLRRRLSRPAH